MSANPPRGDTSSVNALVAANAGLVYRIVRDLKIRGPLQDDAIQAGLERLVKAAQRYDASRGVPFSSFAWPAVSSGVKDLLGAQQLLYEPLKQINNRARSAAKYREMSAAEREAAGEPEPVYRGARIPLDAWDDATGSCIPFELTCSSTEDGIIAALDQTEDEAEALREQLDRLAIELPPDLHGTLILHLEGASQYAISEALGVARSTVQNRLKKAIKALQEAVNDGSE